MTKEELSLAAKSFCDYAWNHVRSKPRAKDDEESRQIFDNEVKLLIASIVDINLKLTPRQTVFQKWAIELDLIKIPKLMSGFIEPYSVKFADDDDCSELLVRTPNFQSKVIEKEVDFAKAVHAFGKRMLGDKSKELELVSFSSMRRQMLFNDAYIYAEYNIDKTSLVQKMKGGFLPLNLKSWTKDFWLEDTFDTDASDMIDKYCRHLFE